MSVHDGDALDIIERQRRRGVFHLKYLEEAVNQIRNRVKSEPTQENIETAEKAAILLTGTPVERYASRLLNVIEHRNLETGTHFRSYQTTGRESINQLVDLYPLLADLHIHLLGTGDAKFWLDQLACFPQIVIPREVLYQAGLECLSSTASKDLVSGDLTHNEKVLVNAFELCEPIPGKFDEGFSPRFILRKFITKNKPEVLTRLILWNAERYVESGVHYAELSLGVGWFNEPFLGAIMEGINRAEEEQSVLFRLLIAFNRRQISELICNPKYLRQLSGLKDRKLAPTEDPSFYVEHCKQLNLAKNTLKLSSSARRFVVGLDIVGNENNCPYTPFLLPDFLDFANDMRGENPNFGFRLHLGEGISADNDIGYVCLRLGEHYISVLAKKHRFRVRSGHGIGLLGLNDEAFNRWKERYPIMRAVAAERLLENLQIASIEINLTSNYYLLKDFGCYSQSDRSMQSHVMGSLLRKGFNIVLGTDDPGIFPQVTMRGEFRKAVDNNLIVDKITFFAIVNESVQASFADRDTINQLSGIIAERYPNVVIPKDKHPIPVFKPLREPIEHEGTKEEEYKRALKGYQMGNPQLIEEWYAKYDPP